MAFSIVVDYTTYTFTGPVRPADLPSRSGCYMVMGSGGSPVYIGESANIHGRVNGNHERKPCWKRNGSGQSIRYCLIPNAATRLKVETAAIRKWQPTCNRT